MQTTARQTTTAHTLAARSFDRRLFAAVAIGFALTVLVGFARTYYVKPLIGGPPLPSTLVHVHGALMTVWVALFVAQVWLISAKQVRVHQRLGYSAIGLAALIIVVGFVTALRAGKYGSPSTPAGVTPLAFMVVPVFDLVMFAAFFGGAIYYRRAPLAHKSLMLLTAINFVPPAIARIPVAALQALGPLWFFGFPTMLALVCIGLDWRRRGRLNAVLSIGTVLLVASYVLRLAWMPTDSWLRVATALTSLV
jgi:hypothetical protein